MATETWPVSLPQSFLQRTYKKSHGSNVIQTKMSVGPPKSRRRATTAVTYHSGSMSMTSSQLDAFETFFWSTIAGGSIDFDFPKPTNLATDIEVYWDNDGDEPYNVSPDGETLDWLVTVKLREIP